MAARLAWLAHLKLTQLRCLAISVGINSSGTKTALTKRLETCLPTSIFATTRRAEDENLRGNDGKLVDKQDVISFDMGIKNLAYCRLRPTKKGKPTLLCDWQRLDVFQHGEETDTSLQSVKQQPAAAPYHPALYAVAANKILRPLILANPLANIVIERQRFRSMGGKGVLEWTIKVNVLEAMLYAVLEASKEQGLWKGVVRDVRPGHVSLYWLGQDSNGVNGGANGGRKGGQSKSGKKKETVKLVYDWLGQNNELKVAEEGVDPTLHDTVKQYKLSLKGKGRGRASNKLDDLADCVAQGMAVLKWDENRQTIWNEGEKALEKLENRWNI